VTPFRFVGGLGGRTDDDTGLVYFWNRWYDPQVGRWINEDPIRTQGGTNLYGYVDNKPVRLHDSTGLLLDEGQSSSSLLGVFSELENKGGLASDIASAIRNMKDYVILTDAQGELPHTTSVGDVIQIYIDTSVKYCFTPPQGPDRELILPIVLGHELGHAIEISKRSEGNNDEEHVRNTYEFPLSTQYMRGHRIDERFKMGEACKCCH
jgi:RHS repeat-associated protein